MCGAGAFQRVSGGAPDGGHFTLTRHRTQPLLGLAREFSSTPYDRVLNIFLDSLGFEAHI